jgi:chondroitin AC lyase
MKKLLSVYILLLVVWLPQLAKSQSSSSREVIMSRIFADLKKTGNSINQTAVQNLVAQQADGSWKDVKYTDQSITNWKPYDHLLKLQSLIQVYLNKESIYYGNQKAFEAISKAFKYWYEKDPKSSNWWHNEIASPQMLGELLIMMRYGKQQLAADFEEQLIERMKRGDMVKQTGANKVDIAMHYFYRALLTNDDALLGISTKELFFPVSLVYQKEGLQYDYAFLQHGPQLQVASYGTVFISGILKLANYLKGTPYGLNAEQLAIFSKYYRDTYLKAIRGSYMDFNGEGRGVSRANILRKANEKTQLKIAKQIDPANLQDFDNAISRTDSTELPSYKIEPYHRHFWTADYTQHLRAAYSFNVRMVSNRTNRSETGNEENLLGRYLSDGATNIQLRGPEYYNIMPIWEWDKIPGTTSRDYVNDRPTTKNWGERGDNAFAGGVSDGVYGTSGYALNHDSLQAKKAWFFFDKEIVCLGAGIQSNTAENITTTVNQSWLNGHVVSPDDDKISSGKTLSLNKNQNWLWHDGVGYYFPQGGDITLSTDIQQGNWHHINHSYSKEMLSGEVFKLSINHGSQPVNAQYAYLVLPGIKEAEMRKLNVNTIQLLSNTDQIQAVYHSSLDMVQAIFYSAGTIALPNMEIKTDKACAILIKNVNGKQVISLADPLQKEQIINLEIKNLKTGMGQKVKVELPQEEYMGSTVEVKK